MYIIAGLGNPTKEYEGTRHNVGFDVIDRLSERYNIDVTMEKHRAYDCRTEGDFGKTADLYES